MKKRILALATLAIGLAGGLAAVSGVAARADGDHRDDAVRAWVGKPDQDVASWRQVQGMVSARHQAQVPGVGLIELDGDTLEVEEVTYEAELDKGSNSAVVDEALAAAAASDYLAAHRVRVDALAARPTELLDHGVYSEYRFTWQERRGDAWLPSYVAVGVNATTGRVAQFARDTVPVTFDTTPRVSADEAKLKAVQASFPTVATTATEPELAVVADGVRRDFVWVTTVEVVHTGDAPFVRQIAATWTDARTGAARVVARAG